MPATSPDETSTESERTRANSRDALLEAAFEEFSTKGYEAATVAGIAERAGVTTGALYAHFSGKLDLLIQTVGLTPAGDVLETMADIVARPWHEASRLLSEGMATRPDRRTLLLLDVIVVARRDPHVAEILRQGLESYLDATRLATETGVARGLLDPALGADDVARMLGLMNLGMIVFGALGEAPPSGHAFARVADLLLQSAGAGDDHEPAALARVRARAATAARAQQDLHDAMAEAAAEGHSLRQVGSAAGLSHERVRQLLRERAASRQTS